MTKVRSRKSRSQIAGAGIAVTSGECHHQNRFGVDDVPLLALAYAWPSTRCSGPPLVKHASMRVVPSS